VYSPVNLESLIREALDEFDKVRMRVIRDVKNGNIPPSFSYGKCKGEAYTSASSGDHDSPLSEGEQVLH
jgi:hypothetical protein